MFKNNDREIRTRALRTNFTYAKEICLRKTLGLKSPQLWTLIVGDQWRPSSMHHEFPPNSSVRCPPPPITWENQSYGGYCASWEQGRVERCMIQGWNLHHFVYNWTFPVPGVKYQVSFLPCLAEAGRTLGMLTSCLMGSNSCLSSEETSNMQAAPHSHLMQVGHLGRLMTNDITKKNNKAKLKVNRTSNSEFPSMVQSCEFSLKNSCSTKDYSQALQWVKTCCPYLLSLTYIFWLKVMGVTSRSRCRSY